jgi:hypothetical protein
LESQTRVRHEIGEQNARTHRPERVIEPVKIVSVSPGVFWISK